MDNPRIRVIPSRPVRIDPPKQPFMLPKPVPATPKK
jgi:hypothetical protein